jgi:CubicO group peptidase (beta-lactamase class C family)
VAEDGSAGKAAEDRIQPEVQASQGKLATTLEPYVLGMMAEHRVPGFVLAVVDHGKLAYEGTFGVANIHTKEPVTTRTLFHLASVTKTVVGTALMQLHTAGKLDLDRPVTEVVPYFVLVDDRYTQLTPRMFAGHVSGMPDFDSNPWHDPAYDEGALERFVRDFVSHKFLTKEPATEFQYCNTGYELLGDVIAKASGQSFEDYVASHILAPAGMSHSTLLLQQADKVQLASPHVPAKDERSKELRVGDIFPYNRMHGPSSTLISDLRDMTRYLRVFLGRGEIDGTRILDRASVDEMWAPALGKFERVGVAWHREQHGGDLVLRHGGSDEGFKSYVLLVPERELGFVFMANSSTLPAKEVSARLLDLLLPSADPNATESEAKQR